MMKTKVLLDTDIGSDIDDAVCLAYLLTQPECELMGITTVTGEADKRAMIADALCKAAGKRIPIFPGCEQPLIIPQKQHRAPQAEALGTWEHEKEFPSGQAIEFLRRTVYRNPGEIVLLTIGPLTNAALLFKMDPNIPSLLKGLVMMAGAFKGRPVPKDRAEWNVFCDPHAAAVVYQTSVSTHRSVGLDVTKQVIMDARKVRERFNKGLLKPVRDLAEVWFQERDVITFHDPLAAATIFHEDICQFENGVVEVELVSERLKGMTLWEANAPGARHEVAVRVDADRFLDHYFSLFE
jgi:inosine-uridine nucleoside N-ribohydrolase